MTISYIGAEIHGLSTDTKPANASIGKIFVETDTGDRFIWTGSWVYLTYSDKLWSGPHDQNSNVVDNASNTEFIDGSTIRFGDQSIQSEASIKNGISGCIASSKLKNALDASGEDSSIQGIFLRGNGLHLYTCGATTNSVYEYTIATPWDLSTASFVSGDVVDVSSETTNPMGVVLKTDGSKMYITDLNKVFEYDLSTPWQIKTAVFLQESAAIAQLTASNDLYIRDDGLKAYITDSTTNNLNEFDFGTAWDVTTLTFNQSINFANGINGVSFRDDGDKMYVIIDTGDIVQEYTVTTPYDISTLILLDEFSIGSQDNAPSSLFFRHDAAKFYFAGNENDSIYEYDIGIKSEGNSIFDSVESNKIAIRDSIEFGDKTTQVAGHNEGFGGNISTLILKQTEVLPDSRNPTGLCIRPNGRRVFIGDDVTNFIFEYNMPTAWDVSSLSAQIASFDVGTAVSATVDLRDIHFRQDGLKMYAVDTNLNRVYEFDLSTDWDISTASYDGKFIAVGAQDGNPFGLFFKPDGTRMYHTGNATDDIFQYDLSIPWDISTAIYNGIFQDLSTQDTAPHSITFSPDGTILYMAGTTTDTIFQYNLAIPWDLIVLTVTTNTFDYSAFDSSIRGLVFKPDFTKAIAAGITNDSLYELDMGLTIEGNILKNGNVGGVSRTGSTTFEIYSESDLPDPVTGVITLPTGVYLFQQGMTLSNQLEIAAGATVELKAPSGSVFAITYLGTASPFISAPDTGSTITTTNIQLVTIGSNMVFINSDAENTRFNDTQMIMTGTGTQKIGTFNNSAGAFTVRDTLFLAKDGLTFTTIDNIQLDGAFGFFTDTSSTTIYDVQALTTGANFDRCRNILDANKTLFDIASSITSPLIVVNFCRSNLATFYDATGLDQTDVNLRAIGNDSPDSMSTGEVSTEDIATPITVTIASQDTPVVIAGGGWASTNLEEFTADSNGILTYIGLSTKQINVAYYALFEKVGGGATDIELTLLRNGSEITANAPRSVNAGIIQISGTDIISMTTNDTLQLAVTNRSGTANIDVSQANLVGSRG